jgi:hypothetical protein
MRRRVFHAKPARIIGSSSMHVTGRPAHTGGIGSRASARAYTKVQYRTDRQSSREAAGPDRDRRHPTPPVAVEAISLACQRRGQRVLPPCGINKVAHG